MAGHARFGFITDTHYDWKYECRRDDALSSLINKTKQCYEWFKANGCEFVVHGGDMFDRHRIYNFDLIRRVRDVFRDGGLKTYYIVGQHDLSGYNMETLPVSNLGFLDAILDGELEVIGDTKDIGGYRFVASHVDMDPAETMKSVGESEMPVVMVCHALLTDQREAFGTISITHFKNRNVKLVLSGDLHDGVQFQHCNGIQFYNPGALARDARGMRMPKVGMLQYDDMMDEFTLEEFSPECAACEDIFFWDDKKDTLPPPVDPEKPVIATKEESAGFLDAFRQFHTEAKDIYELLEKIGRARGVSEDILDLIKKHKDLKTN